MTLDDRLEWLEADGLGGFASGTATGVRTRRYHALLLTATTPPTGRVVLVNGCDAFLTTPGGRWGLSTQRYTPDVLHPDGFQRIARFAADPWPTWEFETPDGYRVRQEIVVAHGTGTTLVVWTLVDGAGTATLEVRPFLSGRDYHATHHENGAFDFTPESHGSTLVWRPYRSSPPIAVGSNGAYRHSPEWYRTFLYTAERERGLDDTEDLASPGLFTWTLDAGDEAVLLLSASEPERPTPDDHAVQQSRHIRSAETARRAAFPKLTDRTADAYLVRRGGGRSVVAGYPWFTDWGRDTFIAIRGLCIATGRLGEARDILIEWAGAVSQGMLPNRFPDAGELPEFNSVDASLWFVVAVHDLLETAGSDTSVIRREERTVLQDAVIRIVEGYAAGTRYGIRADTDGLLAAGEPGVQLTWMDARVGNRVITPRTGKPVEVQALWINALHIASTIDDRWTPMLRTARCTFEDRFWNPERSCLFDVVDVDHASGTADATIRPNQILAVGGLPFAALEGRRARLVVDVVERHLLTPMGLRSLAPSEPGYASRYEGGPGERDAVYHQGTVWPWLLGPFVEAWVRARRNTPTARRRARRRFLDPLTDVIATRGFGHLCEIADADSPFTPRGCPFQAWSLGEVLRVAHALDASAGTRPLMTAENQQPHLQSREAAVPA
jgi:predicted glycogen debranching enzyme